MDANSTPRAALFLVALLLASSAAGAPPDLAADWFVQAESGYASAVATAGDVNGDGYSDIVVGSPLRTYTVSAEGMVYVYFGSANGVDSIADWFYASGKSNGSLGFAVAPAGDVNGDGYDDFLAGAPGVSNGHANEGRVYLFKGGPSSPSVMQTFEMNEEGALFGYSVSWAGDVNGDGYDDILAGAPEWGGYGSPFYIPVQGAARLYHGGPTGPDTTADWSRTGGQTDGDFGYSVAGLGDVNGDGFDDVLIGSPQWDPGIINTNHGKVSCYLGSANGLASSPAWEYTGPSSGAQLGWCVAGAHDMNADGYSDAVFSAPTIGNTGYLLLSLGSSGGLTAPSTYPASPAGFGASIATMGDYDGDGHCDLMAGGGNNQVRIYEGTSQGMFLSTSYTILQSNQAALGGAGDVNGDGFGDFLIGDPFFRIARLYHGESAITTAPNSFASWDGGWPDEKYGASLDVAGDVNGDGYDDVIVGGPRAGLDHQGRIMVYEGTPTGLDPSPAQFRLGGTPDGRYGEAVSMAGDVNGDGYADVVIGEPGADKVYVHHGSADGLQSQPAWQYQFGQAGADFGASVDGAGDLNGDGFADVVVGAPLYDGAHSDQGMAQVFFGSPGGITSAGTLTFTWSQQGARVGASVAGVGDAQRDGFDDVLIGAPGYDLTLVDQGCVFGLFGDAAGLQPSPYQKTGPSTGAAYGSCVAAAGDFDGDGYADAAVGAPLHDEPLSADAGFVEVLLGDGSGLPYSSSQTIAPTLVWAGRRWGQSIGLVGDTQALSRSDIAVASVSLSGHCMVDVIGLRSGNPKILKSHDLPVPGANTVVSSTGDPDGDGLPGLMVGCPENLPEDGSVEFLIPHMTESTYVPDANARITSGADPIAMRGYLAELSGLQFAMDGWLPVGNARLRLEWQLQNAALGYLGVSTSDWVSSNASAGATHLSAAAGSLAEGRRYKWRMRVGSSNPYVPHGRWHTNAPNVGSLYDFTVARVTGVEDTPTTPAVATLDTPYPNPFNPRTRISFRLATAEEVVLRIVDVRGRGVRRIHSGRLVPGQHSFVWDGRDDAGASVASGGYLAVLEVAGQRDSRKLVLVR